MDNNTQIDTGRDFYLLPNIGPPERKRLLDRLGIAPEDIQATGITATGRGKPLLVSGKKIYPVEIPDGLNNTTQIPVYKMSQVERHYEDIDKNTCAGYFLEPGGDKHALDKVKSLGYDRITSLANEAIALKKGDVILIIKNNAYIHPDPDDDRFKVACPEMKELLAPAGRTGIQNIPRYKLDGFLKQEKEDVKSLEFHSLGSIPVNRRTETLCYEAAGKDPLNIKDIPEYMLSRKFVGEIIGMNPLNIAYLPPEKLNRSLYMGAFEKDCSVFRFMPDEYKTESVCMEAYKRINEETGDLLCLTHIVENIPHGSVYMDLLSGSGSPEEFSFILLSIPEHVFNQKIADLAVNIHEQAIRDIPDRFISEQIACKALKADAGLLHFVPDRYKTMERCREAIFAEPDGKINYWLFAAVPYPGLVMEALQSQKYKDCQAVRLADNLPKEAFNSRIATELVGRDASCLTHIPFHLKDEALCLQAIRETQGDMKPLYAIPCTAMTGKVCTELISKFPQALGCILPEDKRTPELCLMAIKADGSLKEHVPESISKDPGMNLYRFGMLVDEQVSLDFKQAKGLYEGKKVEIDYITPNQIPRKLRIGYNKEKNSLEYFDKAQGMQERKNKPENTTPGKRLKM